ncbi:MAG TPA: methylated-DNA--[protein]-cysteine S-methyltransferase [Aldersonia sp.]
MLASTLFETAIGTCGLGWTSVGVARFQLPERDAVTTARRLGGEASPPPPSVRDAIGAIRAHLTGDLDDLRWVDLDLTAVAEFDAGVYAVTRTIDPGATLRYGEVAARVGAPEAAQAVGQALGRNPIPLLVPCHRVLAADGALHGFSAYGGTLTKEALLALERTPGFGEPTLF